MDSTIDMLHPSDALNLSKIRYQLVRLEDTIIFNIIERVQFPYNGAMYKPVAAGGLPIPDHEGSFLEWMLRQTEKVHAHVRRYQAPDEYAFFPDGLPEPFLPPLKYPQLLHPNNVNINSEILDAYINNFLPEACGIRGGNSPKKTNGVRKERGDAQENYGSCSVVDVACLQSLSRRVHFGKFVAEAKFLKEKEKFTKMIKARDIEGITREITDVKVEEQVLNRLRQKAISYGRDPALGNGEAQGPLKVNVEAVVNLYKDWIIPLTKKVEADYLLQRLE